MSDIPYYYETVLDKQDFADLRSIKDRSDVEIIAIRELPDEKVQFTIRGDENIVKTFIGEMKSRGIILESLKFKRLRFG